MLVVMQSHATEEQVRAVCKRIESLGLKAHPIPGSIRTAIGITGNKGAIDLGILESLPGVVECIPVSKPYKLVSRDTKQEDSILRIPTPSGDVIVGGDKIALVAGPCAVETEEQCLAIAGRLKKSGVRLFRGGAYKPRTSPYSFQGLGEEGLKILSKVRKKYGFGIVTEAIDNESLDLVEEYADVIQIGARNMHLHVARADLDDVGVLLDEVEGFVVNRFGDDSEAVFFANFRENLEAVFAEALKTIRGSARLISASAEKPHAGFFEAFSDGEALLLGFDGARAGNEGDLIAANDDVAGGRGDSQDSVFLLGIATDEFVRFTDRDALDDAG